MGAGGESPRTQPARGVRPADEARARRRTRTAGCADQMCWGTGSIGAATPAEEGMAMETRGPFPGHRAPAAP
eukprot:scaffold438_cov110-Isochrysis_galbana.AAC.7